MNRSILHVFVTLLVVLFLAAGVAVASEEEDEKDKKIKPPEKPRPDSAISTVLELPEVKNWGKWMDAKKDGTSLIIWGEALKTVKGIPCWDVAVGEDSPQGVKVWARFCVSQMMGAGMFVEGRQKDPLDDITYFPYEVWQRVCRPTAASPGIC